jgi:methylmalonyl-CoA/ethylmalonyl-CoA epimerase
LISKKWNADDADQLRFAQIFILSHKIITFIKKIVMLKIEHLGIAVKNIAESNLLFEKLLNTSSYKMEEVKSEGVLTSFFKVGENKIELLEATNPDSPIAKFIDKKGEGIHHIAFDVADIRAEMKRLKDEGFVLLNEQPKLGADNKLVCFLHPKGTNGVLIELCQERIDE